MHISHSEVPELVVRADRAALLSALTERVIQWHDEAIDRRGGFAMSLAGGSTPRALYELWASDGWRTRFRWGDVALFFGDERHVPAGDPESNARMVKESLIGGLGDGRPTVHALDTTLSPEKAAADYDNLVSRMLPCDDAGVPILDCALLGMGSDGHTASIFDTSLFGSVCDVTAVANHPESGQTRITLTPQVFAAARHVAFLVTGADKADAVRRNLFGDSDEPAGRIRPVRGTLTWYLDEAAAATLPERVRQ